MWTRSALILSCASAALFSGNALTQDAETADEQAAVGQEAFATREARLEFMKRTLGELQLSFEAEQGTALKLTDSPILRFSNPTRAASSDGGVFLWLEDQRPVAAATIWIRDKEKYGHDFTSLSSKPLRCVRHGKVVWSPAKGILIGQPLAGRSGPTRSLECPRSG